MYCLPTMYNSLLNRLTPFGGSTGHHVSDNGIDDVQQAYHYQRPRGPPGEQNHIQKSLGCCGYPNWAFTKAEKTKEHTQNQNAETGTGTQVTIPYISGLSERIKNTLKSFGIATSYKPTNIIRGKLVHVKDKPPKDKQSNLVYGITCAATDCGEAYVGETKQSLRARINQHRRPSSSEAQNSAVFNYCKTTEHFFMPEEVVILDKEEKWFERGVREAIWERVEQPAINKKGDSLSTAARLGPGFAGSSPSFVT
ncbi:uncharacterized protein [Amphiura filiformis]|uniref:uncharacterized protein n=1 Tax=Amphiura filiformis TaxID=82378 RepID=UPI003B227333